MAVGAAFAAQIALGREGSMPHVTGIGGVFFKAKGNNKALAEWYQKNLGIKLESWGGAALRWAEDPGHKEGTTAWMIADKSSNMFSPSQSNFMINYRVDDLDGLVTNLKKAGIKVEDQNSSELGKFAWIMDPEENKIELWEPPK